MKSLGLVGCGVLAVLSAACGGADVGAAEGALETDVVGEVTQALNTSSVSFQQGKPVVLCGHNANPSCTTLSAAYTGTQDVTEKILGNNVSVLDDARLDAWTKGAFDFAVANVQWDLSAFKGQLPASATLASARVAFKVNTDSPDDFTVATLQNNWTEQDAPDLREILGTIGESVGQLKPRWTGAEGEAPRELIVSVVLARTPVQRWLNASGANPGISIGHPGGPAQRTSLQSSEGATPPKLTLTFSAP